MGRYIPHTFLHPRLHRVWLCQFTCTQHIEANFVGREEKKKKKIIKPVRSNLVMENFRSSTGMVDVVSVVPLILAILFLLGNFMLSRKSRKMPQYGPLAYPIVGCLPSLLQNKSTLLEWFTEMIRNSPTQTIVVEKPFGVRTIVTANPSNVEHMLKNRFENYPKGHQFKYILKDLLGDGIFNSDGAKWQLQRKVASFQFSTRSLKSFIVGVVQENTKQLREVFEHFQHNSMAFDLQEVLQRFAFDSIMRVGFGVDTATLRPTLPNSNMSEAFDVATELSASRDTIPLPIIWKLKRLFKIGTERRLRDAIQTIHGFATDVISKRRQESSDQEDLLSRFFKADSSFKDRFLRDIMISFILAGRDTTSSALTWFFWLLSWHPEVEKTVLAEIQQFLSDKEDSFAYEDLQKMNYLHAALSEAMRLYPPVPVDSKHAADDDVLPDGTVVRKGNRVTFHPYAMGRMPSIWGDDCMEFKPERWLNNEGSFVPESPFKYAVFQGGSRICLGKEMSFIQMKYVVSYILPLFRIRPVNPNMKPHVVHCLTARMHGGFLVTVESRT